MAKNNKEEEEKLHIAMFPWLAFGHMMPYLELAKLFAQKGHRISFISTPRNIDRLPKLPPNVSHDLITMVKLPLPYVHGLPKDAEATADVALEEVLILKRAHDLLRDSVTEFLASSKPDWVLYDFAAFWLPEISRGLGIRSAFFSIFIAACLGFLPTELPDYRSSLEDFMVSPRWITFDSNMTIRKFELMRVIDEITGDDDTISITYRFAGSLCGCDVVAVRSSREVESEWLTLLEERLQKPVFPVGQLFPTPLSSQSQYTWQSMKEWFDEKGTKSVAYVAFGSEAQPSQADLTELAVGLELSGMPFFWAIRGRTGEPIQLPDGFEERVGKRGIVCRSWTPQLEILAHRSVGVFLSHSGWSSVVEALAFEKPLVLLSFANDQGVNEKLLENKKMGYLVPRNQDDGSFTRESVAESLKLVAYGEEGRVYRDKAEEVSPFFSDRALQEKYVDEFLVYLKSHKS